MQKQYTQRTACVSAASLSRNGNAKSIRALQTILQKTRLSPAVRVKGFRESAMTVKVRFLSTGSSRRHGALAGLYAGMSHFLWSAKWFLFPCLLP
eukprot:1226419-Prymnesium_polylepis.1